MDEKFCELIKFFPSEVNKDNLAKQLKKCLGISEDMIMDCKTVSGKLVRELNENEQFVINTLKRHSLFSSFSEHEASEGTGVIRYKKPMGSEIMKKMFGFLDDESLDDEI